MFALETLRSLHDDRRLLDTGSWQELADGLDDQYLPPSEAVSDVLVSKTLAAAQRAEVGTVVVGGGFSANSRLRELMAERGAVHGIEVRIPPIRYCTDNGAMIAALGAAMLRSGVAPSQHAFPADSGMPLTTIAA